MARLKRSCIDDLRARVNIVDVVSPYVTLKKAGAKWKGLSPFNHEKTPSFQVDPAKNLYYCFSSGQGGDIFKFVQTKENLSFFEAVETLAHRFGITLEYEDDGRPQVALSLRKELFDLHEAATVHFHQCFLRADAGGKFIRDYWEQQRKFDLSLAKEFKIGWAPPDGGGLLEVLLKRRISLESLQACGLFYYREGERDPARGRPRFRGRLMIPIRDIQGRVIAFTARQTAHTPTDDASHEAKYVNSPETPLFRKSDILFNLDRAHAPVREAGRFILVEGQLDALRCWSVGLTSAVAPQGTAITENQFALMRRYAGRVDCLLDGDSAGQKAALRALPLALKAGLEIRYLVLPPESDPDELLLEKGAAVLAELDRTALSAMAFAMRSLLPMPNPSAREKADALRSLFEMLAQSDSAILRDDYLAEACRLAGVERTAAERELARFLARPTQRVAPPLAESSPNNSPSSTSSKSEPFNDKLTTVEFELLVLGFHDESLMPAIAQLIDPQWIDTSSWAGRVLDRCLAAHREDAWPGADHLDELLETEEERQLLANLRSRPFQAEDPIQAVDECLKAIFEKYYRRELSQLRTRLANTPLAEKDTMAALMARIKEVQQILRHPPKLPRAA
jgi:DNA primase